MNVEGPARYGVLIALSLLYFLLMAGTFNSLGMVLPAMVKDLGLNWTEAGLGFTLLGTTCGLASLVPAMLIRRIGVSLTLAAGTVVLLAGFAALAATRGTLVYDIATILLGLGFCFCGTVPGVHVISSLFERHSTALGAYFTIGSLGAVAGPLLYMGAQHITGGDWRLYWLLFGVAALAIGGLASLVTRGHAAAGKTPITDAPDVGHDGPEWAVRDALATAQYWVVVLAYTACLLVNTTMHGFAFQHLMEKGLPSATATWLISLSALISAAAAAVAGLVGEKMSPRRMTMLSLGALSIASLSVAVGHGAVVLGVFAVSLAVGLGFSYVSTAILLHDYFGRRAGLELYSVMTLVSTAAALGPGIGGSIRDHTGSFTDLFFALAGVAFVLLVAVGAMRRPVLRSLAPAHAAPGGEAFAARQ